MQALTVGDKGTWISTMKDTLRGNRQNQHAEIELSARTVQRYFKKWNLKKFAGKVKNSGRISAYHDIRCPISLCCLMDTLQKVVNRVNYHSVDDALNTAHSF